MSLKKGRDIKRARWASNPLGIWELLLILMIYLYFYFEINQKFNLIYKCYSD